MAPGNITNIAWSIVAAPFGSSITVASLQGATSATPSFKPDLLGQYLMSSGARRALSGSSGDEALRGTLGNPRPSQLEGAHRCDEREARHREPHSLCVDVALRVQARHHPANVATSHADRTRELVETNQAPSRLFVREVTKNASGDGLEIEMRI